MVQLKNGQILMSDSGERNNKNAAVYQIGPDGKVAGKLLEGLDRAFSIELHEDWLYVAEATSLKRYPFDAKAVKITGEGEELHDMSEYSKGH